MPCVNLSASHFLVDGLAEAPCGIEYVNSWCERPGHENRLRLQLVAAKQHPLGPRGAPEIRLLHPGFLHGGPYIINMNMFVAKALLDCTAEVFGVLTARCRAC